MPNPVRDLMQLQIMSKGSNTVRVVIFDQAGKLIASRTFEQTGRSVMTLDDLMEAILGKE